MRVLVRALYLETGVSHDLFHTLSNKSSPFKAPIEA